MAVTPVVEFPPSSGSQLGHAAFQDGPTQPGDTLRITVPVCPSAFQGATLKLELVFVPTSHQIETKREVAQAQTQTPQTQTPNEYALATDSQSTVSWNLSRAGTVGSELTADWSGYSDSPLHFRHWGQQSEADEVGFEAYMIPPPCCPFLTPVRNRRLQVSSPNDSSLVAMPSSFQTHNQGGVGSTPQHQRRSVRSTDTPTHRHPLRRGEPLRRRSRSRS